MTIERAEYRESYDNEKFKQKIYKSLRAAKIITDVPEPGMDGQSESPTDVGGSHWREHQNIDENFTKSVVDSFGLVPLEATEYLSDQSQAARRIEILDQITEEKGTA